jgi:hypothetical protein
MNIEPDDAQSLTGAGTANYRGNEVGGRAVFNAAHFRFGSKPASLRINRKSASAGCGHAAGLALGRNVPKH